MFSSGKVIISITLLFLMLPCLTFIQMNIFTPRSCPVQLQPAAGSYSTATMEQCGVKFFAQEHLAGSCLDGASVHSSTFYYTTASPTYYLYHWRSVFLYVFIISDYKQGEFLFGRGVTVCFGMSGSICSLYSTVLTLALGRGTSEPTQAHWCGGNAVWIFLQSWLCQACT